MWTLVKGLIAGRSWWLTAAAGAVALVVGIGLGNMWQSGYTAKVQQAFDDYKIAQLEEANRANLLVQNDLQRLQRIQRQILESLQKERQSRNESSDNLIKELQNANGQSCPLSPAVKRYLDGVRKRQGAGID